MKKLYIAVLLASIMISNLPANGIVEEKDIADPQIKFALPDALVGVFEFPQDNRVKNISMKLEIYENNKYIFREAGPDYARNDYGYIIQENGDYYFSPIEGGQIDKKTKIVFNENGFSFLTFMNFELFAVKKEEHNIGQP
jgi:hypothetical protein